SLTIEQSNTPGQTFHRKAMNTFKIQSQKMFLDTNFNSAINVISNIYQNFLEAAMKYYRYVKLMPYGQQPHKALLIQTMRDLIDMAFVLVKGKYRSRTPHEYACAVSKRQVQCDVLGRKQTNFQEVLRWVKGALEEVRPKDRREASRLAKVAQKGRTLFRGLKY
ncbi:MAG: hypothetical protein Q9211_006631, partial [Gyalolechia sp. 1 TL-2023]